MILNNFTVLYVEDSKTMRTYVQDFLSKLVKKVYVANDGKEGIDVYLKEKPDIVISDINMPNIDGLQMSRIIKKSHKDKPIILLTSFNDAEYLKKAIALGISSFVSKPLKEDELVDALTNVANELQNKIDAQKLKDLEAQQEKVHLMIALVKEIGHHWRQPLSAIMALASGYELKKRGGLYQSMEEEIADVNHISKEITKLSMMIQEIQEIDFNNIDMGDIEKIIKVSNPIFEKKT